MLECMVRQPGAFTKFASAPNIDINNYRFGVPRRGIPAWDCCDWKTARCSALCELPALLDVISVDHLGQLVSTSSGSGPFLVRCLLVSPDQRKAVHYHDARPDGVIVVCGCV